MNEALSLVACQDIVARQAVMADYYAQHYRQMEDAYLPDLCAWFEGRAPGVVCEIGPGHGTMIPWWGSRGWRVVVMDIMPLGHWISGDFLAECDARYVERDILDAPLGMEFDAVVMTQVIPHLHFRPDRALRHCAEMLKPGAPLVLTVLDADYYPDLIVPYARWRDVPAFGTAAARSEIVKCMYDEATFGDLLGAVFGAESWRIWRAQSEAVLFAEVVP